jgi:hypothetical protein
LSMLPFTVTRLVASREMSKAIDPRDKNREVGALEFLGQAYRVEFGEIGESVHLDHVVADCVEYAADV